jgi:hypothetical protein
VPRGDAARQQLHAPGAASRRVRPPRSGRTAAPRGGRGHDRCRARRLREDDAPRAVGSRRSPPLRLGPSRVGRRRPDPPAPPHRLGAGRAGPPRPGRRPQPRRTGAVGRRRHAAGAGTVDGEPGTVRARARRRALPHLGRDLPPGRAVGRIPARGLAHGPGGAIGAQVPDGPAPAQRGRRLDRCRRARHVIGRRRPPVRQPRHRCGRLGRADAGAADRGMAWWSPPRRPRPGPARRRGRRHPDRPGPTGRRLPGRGGAVGAARADCALPRALGRARPHVGGTVGRAAGRRWGRSGAGEPRPGREHVPRPARSQGRVVPLPPPVPRDAAGPVAARRP